jgi:hypothetical protein
MAHTARSLKNALQGTALLLCAIVVAEELGFPLDDNSLEDDIASGCLCCDAESRFLDSVILSLLPEGLWVDPVKYEIGATSLMPTVLTALSKPRHHNTPRKPKM